MKSIFVLSTFTVSIFICFQSSAQTNSDDTLNNKTAGKNLYIDVHQLEPGKIKFEDVAAAHAKDLATENKYGVHFINYWVNEEKGLVYCLSSASDSESIRKTHAEAHGLLPEYIYQVTDGTAASLNNQDKFFLDVHYLGAGNVMAKDVAAAHAKDLATEKKYGVNFINYWVDEKAGVVMCLSQAKDSTSVINTHKEAHGLLPAYVLEVKPGE
jgi:phenolic acid decarboxylase